MVVCLGGGSVCVLERGCPYRGSCACPALPPTHPAKNTAGLKPDLPTVWPALSSRLPDAWLCPHLHALGALPTTQDRVQRRPQCQDGQARESQSLGPRAWSCTLLPGLGQPHCPTRAAMGHRAPPSIVDTLSCQALASGQAQTPRTHEFVSQLHDTMGLCPLDKTPTSCLPAA